MANGRLLNQASIGSFARILKNNRIATMGDSRNALGWDTTPGSVRMYARGLQFWTSVLSGGRVEFRPEDQFAVGGRTTKDMLDNIAPVLASPASIVLGWGGTNDIMSAQAPTLADTIANLTAIAAAVTGAGKTLIWIAETPRAFGATNNHLRYLLSIREWQKRVFPTLGVIVADASEALLDRASVSFAPSVATFTDLLHPSALGVYYIARDAVVPIINALFPPSDFLAITPMDVYHATENTRGNLLSNTWMAGTSGTKSGADPTPTGQVADGYTLSGLSSTGMTLAAAKEVVGFKELQRIIFSGSGSSQSPQALFYRNADVGYAEGDVLQGGFYVDCPTSANLQEIAAWLRVSVGGVFTYTQIGTTDWAATPAYMPSEAWKGIYVTPRIILPAGVTEVRLFALVEGRGGAALTANPGFSNFTIRRVG